MIRGFLRRSALVVGGLVATDRRGMAGRRMRVTAALLVCLALAAAGCRATQPDRLRIFSYNIHHGEGTDRVSMLFKYSPPSWREYAHARWHPG